MSNRQSEDWDLCWSYLTKTGCRNSNCKWRHENTDSRRKRMRKYSKKTRGNAVPFYPVQKLQDGGIEDKHGLVQCPDIDDNNRIHFSQNAGNGANFDPTDSISSPMSLSSSEEEFLTSSFISSLMSTSQVGSDPQGDKVKKAVIPIRERAGLREVENCGFSKCILAEYLARTKLKMKLHSDKQITNSLSPFAKVFVPASNTYVKERTTAKLSIDTTKEFLTSTKLKTKFHPKKDSTAFSPFAKVFVPMVDSVKLTSARSTSRKERTMTIPPISAFKQPVLKSGEIFAYE